MSDLTVAAASGIPSHLSGVQPRLVRAAHEFEGQMMKELLKPLLQSDPVMGEDNIGSAGVLNEFATESFGRALSEHGGMGIAHRILEDLSRSGNENEGNRRNQNLHFDT